MVSGLGNWVDGPHQDNSVVNAEGRWGSKEEINDDGQRRVQRRVQRRDVK